MCKVQNYVYLHCILLFISMLKNKNDKYKKKSLLAEKKSVIDILCAKAIPKQILTKNTIR